MSAQHESAQPVPAPLPPLPETDPLARQSTADCNAAIAMHQSLNSMFDAIFGRPR